MQHQPVGPKRWHKHGSVGAGQVIVDLVAQEDPLYGSLPQDLPVPAALLRLLPHGFRQFPPVLAGQPSVGKVEQLTGQLHEPLVLHRVVKRTERLDQRRQHLLIRHLRVEQLLVHSRAVRQLGEVVVAQQLSQRARKRGTAVNVRVDVNDGNGHDLLEEPPFKSLRCSHLALPTQSDRTEALFYGKRAEE